MDDFARAAAYDHAVAAAARRRGFAIHGVVWLAVNAFLVVVWAVTGAGFPWFVFPLLGWGIGVAAHAAAVFIGRSPEEIAMDRIAERPS